MSLGLFFAVAAPPAGAQVALLPDEVERVDVIAIERDGRDVFAFDALTGRRSTVRLEKAEEVRFERSRGRVGLLLTDRRALAVAPGVDWQEIRYALKELVPGPGLELVLVEDRIAMVVTARRALGFTANGIWVEERFSPHEGAEALRVGSAAGVVATNRRVLALGPDLNRFVEIDLQLNEVLESVSAEGTLATVRTNRRILVFAAPRGSWAAQKRRLK